MSYKNNQNVRNTRSMHCILLIIELSNVKLIHYSLKLIQLYLKIQKYKYKIKTVFFFMNYDDLIKDL